MFGSVLVHIMKTKLPDDLKLILSRKFDEASEVWEEKRDRIDRMKIQIQQIQ